MVGQGEDRVLRLLAHGCRSVGGGHEGGGLTVGGDFGLELGVGVGQRLRLDELIVAQSAQRQAGGQVVTIGAHRLASNSSRIFLMPSRILDLIVPNGTLRVSEICAWVIP